MLRAMGFYVHAYIIGVGRRMGLHLLVQNGCRANSSQLETAFVHAYACVCVCSTRNTLHSTSKIHKEARVGFVVWLTADYIMNFKYPFHLLNIGPAALGPAGPAPAPVYIQYKSPGHLGIPV